MFVQTQMLQLGDVEVGLYRLNAGFVPGVNRQTVKGLFWVDDVQK